MSHATGFKYNRSISDAGDELSDDAEFFGEVANQNAGELAS